MSLWSSQIKIKNSREHPHFHFFNTQDRIWFKWSLIWLLTLTVSFHFNINYWGFYSFKQCNIQINSKVYDIYYKSLTKKITYILWKNKFGLPPLSLCKITLDNDISSIISKIKNLVQRLFFICFSSNHSASPQNGIPTPPTANTLSHMLEFKHRLFTKPSLTSWISNSLWQAFISSYIFTSRQWSQLQFYLCICNLVNICLSFTLWMFLFVECVCIYNLLNLQHLLLLSDHKENFQPNK